MNTKLTLRMDEAVVRHAKSQAARRGKSVSQMFSEFMNSLDARRLTGHLPPVTASLVGILKHKAPSESDYREHLREKHL